MVLSYCGVFSIFCSVSSVMGNLSILRSARGCLLHKMTHDYTNCCIYTVDPPDDEQQACSKHVEAYY
jgi:hypothetical protein